MSLRFDLPCRDRYRRVGTELFVPGNLAAVVAKVVVNCCPCSGTAPQIRQTSPLSRHRFAQTLPFSRSALSVMRKKYRARCAN